MVLSFASQTMHPASFLGFGFSLELHSCRTATRVETPLGIDLSGGEICSAADQSQPDHGTKLRSLRSTQPYENARARFNSCGFLLQGGHTEVVETLCNLDLNLIRPQLLCVGKLGDHIVAAAARGGDHRIMAALLEVCPDYADRPCPGKNTPLGMTKWNSDYKATEVAEELLATGLVDIESTNEFGMTPLMGGFSASKLDLCKLLIRYGADLYKVIHVSEHDEPACLVSTGFPAQDVKMRNALLGFSYTIKRTV